jgi:glycerol-3-phosphate dehydrogenase
VSLLREAARRGLSACLCEAGDFGGGTTWNSLRIVHGGLRYLQTLDLPALLPVGGVAPPVRKAVPGARAADAVPDAAVWAGHEARLRDAHGAADERRAEQPSQRGLRRSRALPAGRVVDAAQTARFPGVRREGLEGAATWSDYFMVSSERILMEQLRDACRRGATASTTRRCSRWSWKAARSAACVVRTRRRRRDEIVAASRVVNCAGPQRARAGGRAGADDERLFRPSLAFNLLLDVDAAARARRWRWPRRSRARRSCSWCRSRARCFAGTLHLPRPAGTTEAWSPSRNRPVPRAAERGDPGARCAGCPTSGACSRGCCPRSPDRVERAHKT